MFLGGGLERDDGGFLPDAYLHLVRKNYDFQLEVEIIRMTASVWHDCAECRLRKMILLIELFLYFKTMFPEREG